jgi:hypothetical protein
MSEDEKKYTQAFEDLKTSILKNTIITDGIISNVRESEVLCDVTISKNLYTDVPFHVLVNSQPSILQVPAEKSPCLICLRNANFTTPQILFIQNVSKYLITIGSMTFQLTKDGIILNGGQNDGMVLINPLNDNLKSIQTFCNAIQAACLAAYTAQSGIDASAGLNAFNSAMTGQGITIKEMNNDKIKQ